MSKNNNSTLVFSIALKGYENLFKPCIKSHLHYCNLHKYKYIVIESSPRELCAAEAAWLKIPLAKAALEGGYKWVAFIDADCEIRTHMPPFPKYLDSLSKSEKSIFISTGFSGRLNSGVLFLKNSPQSLEFLDLIFSNCDHEIPSEDRAKTRYENGHVIYFGKNNPYVYVLDHNVWNNNSKLDENSFIQHYSGGRLRNWYMENRAPSEYIQNYIASDSPSNQRLFLNRVFRKITKVINLNKNSKLIYDSLNELLPYYQKKYSHLFDSSCTD